MPTNQRPSRSKATIAAVCVFAATIAAAAPARAQTADPESALRAAYPALAAPSAASASYAGVALGRLVLPGLHLRTREDQTVEHGGITLVFADDQDVQRATVRVAVARDAAAARTFALDTVRGVSGGLDPSAVDDIAYADAGDRFLVAVHGNVAYVVLGDKASSVAAIVKRAITAGAPVFPAARVTLPSSFEKAAPIAVSAPSGAKVHLRATGAYVARGKEQTTLRPFAPGRVSVTAIVADDLGRVAEATASAVAN